MSGQVLLMPDHFCIVSDHAELKSIFDRRNVSPAADSLCTYEMHMLCVCVQTNRSNRDLETQ